MIRVRLLIAVALVLPIALPGTAQVPSAPVEPVLMEMPVSDPKILDTWAALFYGHRWEELQVAVQSTLDTSRFDRELLPKGVIPPPIHQFDFKHNYYRIAFVSKFAKSDGEEIQFLVHAGFLEPYASRLPGVDDLFDVFLDTQGDATMRSTYLSARVPNPLLEKLPSFIKQIDLTGLAKLTSRRPQAVGTKLYVHVSRVQLPFRRATIAISDETTIPPGLDRPELGKASTNLQESLALRTAAGSKCALLTSQCLDAALRAELGEDVSGSNCPSTHHNQPPTPQEAAECRKPLSDGGKLRCLTDHRLRKTYSFVVKNDISCTTGTANDFAATTKVEEAYKTLLAGSPAKVKKDVTYENVPLEHLSFGAIAAVMGSTSGDRRVKLDSGNLTANPISGTLSMATLNIHPKRYDPKTATPTQAERFRFFVGACLTPEFGLGAGLGYSFIRGLSINAGYAWMRVDSLRKGDSLGAPPSRPKDPFENGVGETFFVGFGYNF
jgi:hypothetical protein